MRSLSMVCVLLAIAQVSEAQPNRRRVPLVDYWPEGIVGAVSLTFDDGLPSQLATAIPILNKHGLRGTFYVNAGPNIKWTVQEELWRPVGAQGHELGNHASRHPCSCNHTWIARDLCLDNIDLQDIREALAITESVLDTLAPSQAGARSFAYPCYESWVGRGAERESYVPIIAGSFIGGRAGLEMSNDPRWVDLPFTRSFEMHGQSTDEVIGMIEGGLRRGHWVVLTFHGVGGDYIETSAEDFDKIVQYLAQERQRIWTGTFYDVASYISERQAVGTAMPAR